MFKTLFALTISALALAACDNQSSSTLSKADVEQIVADYIMNNGDKIIAGVQLHQQREQMAASQKVLSPHTPVRGKTDSTISIIEFSDLECPFCSRVQPTVSEIFKKYSDRVKFAFKHYPLPFHAQAIPAAQAAQAAHKQGKFWEFRDELFAHQDKLEDVFYTQTAKKLGLDVAKFNADRASDEIKKQVEQDMTDAQSVGVRGTPYFLINGQALSGAQPLEEFEKAINLALQQAQ